jgi:hypothetical protein
VTSVGKIRVLVSLQAPPFQDGDLTATFSEGVLSVQAQFGSEFVKPRTMRVGDNNLRMGFVKCSQSEILFSLGLRKKINTMLQANPFYPLTEDPVENQLLTSEGGANQLDIPKCDPIVSPHMMMVDDPTNPMTGAVMMDVDGMVGQPVDPMPDADMMDIDGTSLVDKPRESIVDVEMTDATIRYDYINGKSVCLIFDLPAYADLPLLKTYQSLYPEKFCLRFASNHHQFFPLQ